MPGMRKCIEVSSGELSWTASVPAMVLVKTEQLLRDLGISVKLYIRDDTESLDGRLIICGEVEE